jgi:hypothetical protein
MSLISTDMRAAIGRELSRSTSFPISESDVRRWAIATYYPDPPPARFWDAKDGGRIGFGGIAVPEEFNPFAWMAAEVQTEPGIDRMDPDHTELRLGLAGPGLKNQLNGGVSVDYGVPMRPGDVIESVVTLADYTERPGRLGDMLFTVTEDLWRNERAETVRRYRFTLIRY